MGLSSIQPMMACGWLGVGGGKLPEGYLWQMLVSTEMGSLTWIPSYSRCVHSCWQEHTYVYLTGSPQAHTML